MLNALTQERLKELLEYDPETGVFTWRKTESTNSRGRWSNAGKRAGCDHPHSNGSGGNSAKRRLILIGIDYSLYRAHRLAWLYVYGEMPKGGVDHINGDARDNRIANLRLATSQLNSQNMRRAQPYNSTGMLGAGMDKARNCFKSEIRLPNGRRKFLGRFKTAQEAQNAYIEAKRKYHDGCTI